MPPRLTAVDPVAAVLSNLISALPVPLWAPWPMLPDWVFSGLAHTALGDPEPASVSSWSGPDQFGDPVELLLICEEAAAGIGCQFAGTPLGYPGPEVGEGPSHARFTVADRAVPLWAVEAVEGDRAAYAGEAAGRWLWVVVHPAEGCALVVEPLTLVDARDLGAELAVLPVGELTPRLLID